LNRRARSRDAQSLLRSRRRRRCRTHQRSRQYPRADRPQPQRAPAPRNPACAALPNPRASRARLRDRRSDRRTIPGGRAPTPSNARTSSRRNPSRDCGSSPNSCWSLSLRPWPPSACAAPESVAASLWPSAAVGRPGAVHARASSASGPDEARCTAHRPRLHQIAVRAGFQDPPPKSTKPPRRSTTARAGASLHRSAARPAAIASPTRHRPSLRAHRETWARSARSDRSGHSALGPKPIARPPASCPRRVRLERARCARRLRGRAGPCGPRSANHSSNASRASRSITSGGAPATSASMKRAIRLLISARMASSSSSGGCDRAKASRSATSRAAFTSAETALARRSASSVSPATIVSSASASMARSEAAVSLKCVGPGPSADFSTMPDNRRRPVPVG
jgi:hypothetical protein